MGGDLTRLLRGKLVAHVATNGHLLAIVCNDKSEILIKWVDDNGNTIKGMPIVESRGFRMKVEGMQDLVLGKAVGI